MSINIPSIRATGTAPTLENDFFRQSTRFIYGINIDDDPTKNSPDAIKEANRVWNDFLFKITKTNEDFIAEVGDGKTQRTQAQEEALNKYMMLYNEFLLNRLDYVYQSNALNLLSPEEIESRDVLFRTFSLVLDMLSALQKTVGLVTEAYAVYTKWQAEYSKLTSKIPMYTQSPSYFPLRNLSDLSQSYVGAYGNVTMTEVVQALLKQVQDANGAKKIYTITFTGPVDDNSSGGIQHYTETYLLNNMGDAISLSCDIKLQSPASSPSGVSNLFLVSVNKTDDGFTMNLNDAEERNNIASALLRKATADVNNMTLHPPDSVFATWSAGTPSTSFNILWGSPSDTGETGIFSLRRIFKEPIWGAAWGMAPVPWNPKTVGKVEYPTNPTTDQKTTVDQANKEKAQNRGELNSQLQLYIDTAKSRSQVIQNQSKPIENLINQCRESIQAQMNLCNSIMDTMKGIISAVFRV